MFTFSSWPKIMLGFRYTMEHKAPKRPPLAKKRNNSACSELNRHSNFSSNLETSLPSPLPSQSPFYRSDSKANLSSIFGGYVSSIRSGRLSGYSTPKQGTPHGSETEDLPHYPHHHRRKRKKAEVFVSAEFLSVS